MLLVVLAYDIVGNFLVDLNHHPSPSASASASPPPSPSPSPSLPPRVPSSPASAKSSTRIARISSGPRPRGREKPEEARQARSRLGESNRVWLEENESRLTAALLLLHQPSCTSSRIVMHQEPDRNAPGAGVFTLASDDATETRSSAMARSDRMTCRNFQATRTSKCSRENEDEDEADRGGRSANAHPRK
eukprot:766466-Hanusia_phi.AAC.1